MTHPNKIRVRLTCGIIFMLASGFMGAAAVPDAAQSERFWLAGQYDGSRVIVYFGAVKFGATFPHDARKLPDPTVFGFFSPRELPASYVVPLQKEFNIESFRAGDRYVLLAENGAVRTLTLTTLIGFYADEQVGNDSLVGAIGTVDGESPLLLTKGYYVVRRPEGASTAESSRNKGAKPSRAGLLDEPVRFDVQRRIAHLLDERMKQATTKTPGYDDGTTAPAFVVQPLHLATGALRYYVRAEWRNPTAGARGVPYRLGAWIVPGAAARILAAEAPTSAGVYGFEQALPNLLNVVDLGHGRTGLIVHIAGLDSTELTLYEYRDRASLSEMRVLHSIGVGE
jgi:hypothetical protein